MSRITQKGATSPLDPFRNISTGVPNQAYSAVPGSGAQPSTGVGVFLPDFSSYIGQKFDTSDGRELVIVKNGTTAIAAGKLYTTQSQASSAYQKLAMTVPTAYPATAGLFQVYVTNGSTVLNQNAFAGGYLVVEANTGAGQTFKIASHGAAAASAKFVVNLEDPIQTTLDATSTVSILPNPYDGVVISSHSSPVLCPVGVSLNIVAASTAATYDGTSGLLTANGVGQYGFLVCHGPAMCLIDTTTTVAYPLGCGVSNYDGSLQVATLTTSAQVAISMQTQTSNHYGMVYMQL
jgi:hypothetical protein